jgi:glycerophosphoryl diester phosphodiesterase
MKVMAHRGYSGVYPENTMLSFREAVKVGCDAIEMDVHETRDGRLVVIHDERLDRTTDGSGRICDHSFAELQQVNAAARFAGKYAPERIPSFDEYCEWASGESVGHNIEIKTDKIYYHDIERKIWATIERYGLEKKVMFSSFNHISLRKILEISGNAVEVGALVLEDSIGGFPGYYGINIQQHAAFMVPILNKNLGSYYVDQAVSCGIPGDMCTLPLVETGVAVEGEYPDIGNCWLTTNNPCDANMMDNVAMYRALSSDGKKAVHPFTTPLMYDDPTCKELGVHEVYDAIHFLEEQFHQPFNWDTFIQHIENTNQFNREETERWDIYAKTNNGALNPVCQGLFRIYFYQQGGNEYFLKASRKITRIFDKCVRRNIDTFPHTRHRAIAWSCGSTYYAHGVQWLYNCWGILCLINMDSLTGHNIVDTEDRDVMMSDVADWHARTPMRTHTVGGNRHIMQMWETAEKFNCDMIIMYDDIGCKGMAGAQGLIEEEIRKHDERFHTVWMPHSLMDHRIVSPAEARRTVNEYMINVMHEEPVDPSLLDFDDSMGW